MFQKVIVVGRLGRDPEMRFTATGQAVTSFSLATDRQYTGQDGKVVKETTWFKVTTWGKLAENCNQYLLKGSMALVEGRLTPDKDGSPRVWADQQGVARASFELTAEVVRFLGTGKAQTAAPGTSTEEASLAENNLDGADDFPY